MYKHVNHIKQEFKYQPIRGGAGHDEYIENINKLNNDMSSNEDKYHEVLKWIELTKIKESNFIKSDEYQKLSNDNDK